MAKISAGEMVSVDTKMPREMVEQLEQRVKDGTYPNRSEAVRDAVRRMLGLPKRTSLKVASNEGET